MYRLILLTFSWLFCVTAPNNVTICTQNLHNFGQEKGPITQNLRATLLGERIKNGKCDIVALQEVTAKRTDYARKTCKVLTDKLKELTYADWDCVVGDTEDGPHRLAFIWKVRNINLVEAFSYKNLDVPKLSKIDASSHFNRIPLEAIFRIKFSEVSRYVAAINIHLKSKAGAEKDPTGLKWEIVRMEQAEAIRKQALDRLISRKEKMPVLILGDRNSDYRSPTAKILAGELHLADFAGNAPCRISKSLVPVCLKEIPRNPIFASPITLDKANLSVGGTFRYRKKLQFLDDILIDVNHLGLVQKSHFSLKEFDAGIIFEPLEASDHALLWAKLKF
ncbi:MAG: hypothetical protein NZT61_04570 [Deltaproteobacteria bacterium]|nr:hypothetical protein [Deltaproteobacteria bacterium]